MVFNFLLVFGYYVWAGFDDPAGRRLRNGSAKPEKLEKHLLSGFCRATDLKNLKSKCFFQVCVEPGT